MTILGHGMPYIDPAFRGKKPSPQAPLIQDPLAGPEFFSRQVQAARRFFLDLNPQRTRPVAVVCGGLERTTADYRINRQTFPLYSIEYVVGGRGQLKLGNEQHELKTGRVFSYGPGVAHEIDCDQRDPLVKYFLDFSGPAARNCLKSAGLPPGSVVQVFPPLELQGLFEELVRCGLKGTRLSAALCDKLLQCLILKIQDSHGPAEGPEQLAFSTYQHCRQYIQQHFHRLKSLEQVSAECRVNNAYLCRLFGRYDHQSPYQYLLRLKMARAAEQLREPGTLVKQVAEDAGFSDPFHFSRAFKRVFGVSPKAFRGIR